ncbi:aminomethyl-transferring glycine dehydrogenase subunit GcvPA [Halobacterium sp. MBLA0001]|uniref:aminomethyl-transferring glycine dehydrogenase subunit GcvPA n=1 Tax=Halobacterium TaxID=2239 RepID=UPI001963C1AD|nr:MULTISPECIES: aminomethyl-transferring glycine dehydrogenase subunit GcvPA [Halobacterium]MCF2165966.1 aminomethyl-transferring glycine dehydrogenase subunit GcvPA [Halobacterium salinarum]MCF2167485.1 aminomethyl-transferring glycine dehydrogenase subunit GcvPA [Halobacterium salinarum]MCF2238824.1 aminomethyl-transferring glycine dehydrogenase subunit GcvPA [Halobacterium salinarum]QRY21927.1 aminomethyl-transferring glycine dehydrogenase subunit GcvPA [Halobacterium sp. GSL-19]
MSGSPYASPSEADTDAMLDAVGVDRVDELFDIPPEVSFDGEFGIDTKSEQAALRGVRRRLSNNDDLTEFLGRGHYEHYVPSLVDSVSQRSEFITSYTQYQPEITQGFLQVLFEYQSLLVELTGLGVANCSMYDAATALAEAALLAKRVRAADGNRVLVPGFVRDSHVDVLRNYTSGSDVVVERYATDAGNVDLDALEAAMDADVVMVYAENPTTCGTVEEQLCAVGDLADSHDALFCLGSDPVAMSILQRPVDVGADVVVGDASVLGMPTSYGTGLGVFATREEFLRQVPGRLVGASEDDAGTRAFTLTLQTREQHIRKERATSNICTNQAWVALRAAIHAAWLGADGLVDLAERMVELPRDLAARLDDVSGVTAPVHDDRHHIREFQARTEQPAPAVASALEAEGFGVHAVDDHTIQVCVTDANEHATDAFVAAVREVSE